MPHLNTELETIMDYLNICDWNFKNDFSISYNCIQVNQILFFLQLFWNNMRIRISNNIIQFYVYLLHYRFYSNLISLFLFFSFVDFLINYLNHRSYLAMEHHTGSQILHIFLFNSQWHLEMSLKETPLRKMHFFPIKIDAYRDAVTLPEAKLNNIIQKIQSRAFLCIYQCLNDNIYHWNLS